MSDKDRLVVGEAVFAYARARQSSLENPPPDAAKALFGHCNRQDDLSQCLDILRTWRCDPSEIPLLTNVDVDSQWRQMERDLPDSPIPASMDCNYQTSFLLG